MKSLYVTTSTSCKSIPNSPTVSLLLPLLNQYPGVICCCTPDDRRRHRQGIGDLYCRRRIASVSYRLPLPRPPLLSDVRGGAKTTGAPMSYMKGDLLKKTRRLVKGLAKPTPVWLKAMEEAPPVTFPRTDGEIKRIEYPEDVYVRRFFKKHPDSLYHDAVKISGFDPPPARVFAWRVLELKEQGVSDDDAMAVADMEYRAEKKAKKKAYSELKQIARLQGKKPPPNPYPSAIKEIQSEEKKYVRDRFFNPKILQIVEKMKAEAVERAAEKQERQRGQTGNQSGGLIGRDGQPGSWNNSGGQPGGLNNISGQPGGWNNSRGQPGGWNNSGGRY